MQEILLKIRMKGEITAFLSITIFLVLAVVGTVIESARVKVSGFYTERALKTAVDSVFTEYCKPLYDNYHLFFLEEDNLSGEDGGITVEDKVKDYMKYTFQPETQLILPNHSFYDIITDHVEVKDFVKAVDGDGKVFSSQVEAYMKYAAQGEVLSKILEQTKLLGQSNEKVTILKEQQKAEEKIAEFNKSTMELVGLIEGISFGKNGLEYTTGGLIKARPSFVKQLGCNISDMESVGVHHDLVWKSMEDKYYDIDSYIKKIEKGLLKLEGVSRASATQKILYSINVERGNLVEKTNNIIGNIEKALVIVEDLSKKKKEVETYVEEHKIKSYMGQEIATDQGTPIKISYVKLRGILERNRDILQRVKDLGVVSVDEMKEQIMSLKVVLESYDIKSLQFDYSSLVVKKDTPNPIEKVENLIKDGMSNLILENPKSLSTKKLICENYGMNKDSKTDELDEGWINSSEDTKTTKYLDEFNSMCNGNGVLTEDIGDILGTVLMEEYVKEHFKSFLEPNEINRDTLMDYEKEYIIEGKKSDRENLYQVIERLVLVRMVFCFLYLLTDKNKTEMAYLTAAALIGFTCLEPLVRATQVLILAFWSIVEALVEVGALLKGKELPLLKSRDNFMVSYPELLCINRDFIQKKIQQVPMTGKSGISLDYKDYLTLFILILNKSDRDSRIMNLIEENMKLTYRKGFSLKKTIAGMTFTASWKVPTKFIDLNFVNKILHQKKGYWVIESSVGNVY